MSVREITLQGKNGKGLTALVDEQDYPILSQFKWYAMKRKRTTYVFTNIENPNKPPRYHTKYMHRMIMGGDSKLIDHRDGNGLNNRRYNLRVADHGRNTHNRPGDVGSASKYKGVHRKDKRWSASIMKDGTVYYLGRFDSEEQAARAYNDKALELFGEFAWLNQVN